MSDFVYLEELEAVIARRRDDPSPDSYVSGLLDTGPGEAEAKVLEEAHEVVAASATADIPAIKHEAADLLFHLLVLLAAHDLNLTDVIETLERRRRHDAE